MTTERFGLDGSVGARQRIFGRLKIIVPLVAVSFALLTASAQAHSVSTVATCKSVTFNWTSFSSSGSRNGGLNTPDWSVSFTPTGGPTTTLTGRASFSGKSFSLTVPIAGGNGNVVASSQWSSSQTRDGDSGGKSNTLKIKDCPVQIVLAPPTSMAKPALSTTAAAAVALGESITDTATLSGGIAPTGTITFNVYAATDTTCSTVLFQVATPVSGNGAYASPAVTPTAPGSYQWVANYSGDASNEAVSGQCNDPAEQSAVNAKLVKGVCVRAPVTLRGFSMAVRSSLTAHVPATGVKSVTFYLDGRKLSTVTKPRHQRFSLRVNLRGLHYGYHRLRANVVMRSSLCGNSRAAGAFIRIRPRQIPKFVG